jgi:amino acid transporter
MIVLYGLGTTIGAGIYALLGEVAGSAGIYAPASFLVASVLAGFSAFTFAELVARFPSSAGEARYVREAFGSARLSVLVGLLVVLAGSVSAAAISNGFAGYFQEFVPAPRMLAVTGVIVLLGLLAAWGIGESVLAAGALTVLEIGGLLLVIWAGHGALAQPPVAPADLVPPLEAAVWGGVFTGSFLAFFAFIGFEDMVNVAEEVRDVTRTLPRAIIVTLVVTLALYLALSVVAVRALPIEELAGSRAPLALIYERSTGSSGALIGLIAVVATVNGALIQIIMASRVLYGLAAQGLLPGRLARIHPVTRTPLLATALVTCFVLALALPFRIGALAEATSVVALIVFALVNLALLRVKRRVPQPGGFVVPAWVPGIGFVVSAGFVVAAAVRALVF